MTQFTIHAQGQTLRIYSFTTGFINCPKPKIKKESDALAYALWLSNHGYEREAEDFLDRYCALAP